MHGRVQRFANDKINQSDKYEEIHSRLNSGNTCWHLIQNVVFILISKNIKITIYGTIILPVVLYGFETWFLILREEQRLMVFGNRVLRKISQFIMEEVTGNCRKMHNE